MPSPAALAKYVVSFIVAPLSHEGIDSALSRGGRNYQVDHGCKDIVPNYKITNNPFDRGGINYQVNHGDMNTPILHEGMQAPVINGDVCNAGNSGIYLCVDGGFSGHCRWFSAPFGQCTNLDGDLARKVSSAGPDKGNWCTLYADWGCRGEEYQLHWPGESHLGDRGYGDKAVAYNCAAE